MSLSSTFPSFEDFSGFNYSPFGAFWEKEEAQKMNFKLLTDNSKSTKSEINRRFTLALATDTPTINNKISEITGVDNFTVFIVGKSGTIKNFSGETNQASEFTGLKNENIIEIRAVKLGYNLLGSRLSRETIKNWVDDFDKWMNPSGFFSSEQLDFIYKEAVNYYESNKFTILTQPVTNKILIMLLEALRKDLQYYFNEDYVAKFLQQIALEFKNNAMITDPNRWNPYLANQERNPDYNPYFITNINAEKIRMEDAVQQFEGLLDQSALDVLLISALQTKVPLEIRSLLSAIYKYVKDGFIEMYQDAKAMLQTFADLPEMYNAFLVGLYNGLIRFLASLIEMVGFFVSLANPGNWESFVEGFKKFFSEFWSTLKTLLAAYFKKFTAAQNPVDFIKIFIEEITGIAIELFLLYVSLGTSAAKKLSEGLERLLKNPKATVEDWMDYFKKRKKEDIDEKPVDKALDDLEKLKTAQKMWDELKYKDLLEIPPSKKPCFLAGTLVKTENGLVPIEDISVGQKIYAYNFEIKRIELKSVTQIFRSKAERFVRIGIKDNFIEATGQHRFWLPEEKRWEMANGLKSGMKLLNSGGKIIIISSIEVLSELVDTFNLEVEDHHNYYVGVDEVLTHNKTRTSIFASTDLIDVEFYRIIEEVGDNLNSIYVGQTIQGIGKRYDQHKIDPKKLGWSNKMNGVLEIKINGKSGPFKMTPYEAAVTELYEINTRGGVRKGNNGLYNKQKPIGKKKFEQFKKLGFNPCKFYV